MTDVQFERWLDFAVRLAKVGYAHLPARASKKREGVPHRKWVEEQVREFITGWVPECDRVCVRGWDGSDPYPEGHQFYRRTIRGWTCHRCKGKGCVGAAAHAGCAGGFGVEFARPAGVGDMFSSWRCGEYFDWRRHTSPAEDAELDEIHDRWRYGGRKTDDEADRLEEREVAVRGAVEARWLDPVSACVRAGLDVASEPSAGVAGFTAGDVRKMYGGKVPGWVKAFFEGHETQVLTGRSACGTLLRYEAAKVSKKEAKRRAAFATRFDSFLDADEVWL